MTSPSTSSVIGGIDAMCVGKRFSSFASSFIAAAAMIGGSAERMGRGTVSGSRASRRRSATMKLLGLQNKS